MTDRCRCDCHDAATEDGVDVCDLLEAAVALGCHCLPDHCPALLDQPPERFLGDVSTAWVDPLPDPREPEGRE